MYAISKMNVLQCELKCMTLEIAITFIPSHDRKYI